VLSLRVEELSFERPTPTIRCRVKTVIAFALSTRDGGNLAPWRLEADVAQEAGWMEG